MIETMEPSGLAVGESMAIARRPLDNDAGQSSLTTALHKIYEDFEAGKIPLAEAPQKYGKTLGEHPQTSRALAKLLVSHGLLANHIPRSGSAGTTFGKNTRQKVQFLFQEIEDHETIEIAQAKTLYERVLGKPHDRSQLALRLTDYGLPSSHLEGRYERDMRVEGCRFSDESWSPWDDPEKPGLSIDSDVYQEVVYTLEAEVVRYRVKKMEFHELVRTLRVVLPDLPYDDVDLSDMLTDLDVTPRELAADLVTENCESDSPPGSGQTEGREAKYQDPDASFSSPPAPNIEKGPPLSDREKDLVQTISGYINLHRKGEINSQTLCHIICEDLLGMPWTDEHLSKIINHEEESSDEIARLLVIQTFRKSFYDERSDEGEEQACPRISNTTIEVEKDRRINALSAVIEAFRSSQLDLGETILEINSKAGNSLESNCLVDRLTDDRLTTEETTRAILKYRRGWQVPSEVGHQAGQEIPKKDQILYIRPPKKPVVLQPRPPTPVDTCSVSIETPAGCIRVGVSQGIAPGTPPPELDMEKAQYRQRFDRVAVPNDDESLRSQCDDEKTRRGRILFQDHTIRNTSGVIQETGFGSTPKKPSNMPPPSSTNSPASHRVCGSAGSRFRGEGAPTPESSQVRRRRSGTPIPELPQSATSFTIPEIVALELRKELSHPETFGDLSHKVVQPDEWKRFMRGSAGYPIAEYYNLSKMSTSPEDCTTEDLFGLDMPTEKARNIGHKLELPPDFVQEMIRSKTLNRVNLKKTVKANSTVTLPSPKRQASRALSEEYGQSSPRLCTKDTQFALDGEDNYAFIRRRLTPALMDQVVSIPSRPNKKENKKRKKGAALHTLIPDLKVVLESPVPSAEPASVRALDTSSDNLNLPGSFDSIDKDFLNHGKTDIEEAVAKPCNEIKITELLNDE